MRGGIGSGWRPNGGDTVSLYRINSATGAAYLVGQMSAVGASTLGTSPAGIVYGWNAGGPENTRGLHTDDPTIGNSLVVGPGGSQAVMQDLAFDSNGTLWGIGDDPFNPHSVFTIDPMTGVQTFMFALHGDELTGLAFISPVPVPAAVWLLGSGLAAVIGVARRSPNQMAA